MSAAPQADRRPDPNAAAAGSANGPGREDRPPATPAPATRSGAFRALEGLSITHSLIYLGLIAMWLTDGPAGLRRSLGWAHGILWIVMSILVLLAARKAIVSFRLAVLVAVIGGLGPFAGTAGFLWEGRRRSTDDELSRGRGELSPSLQDGTPDER